MQNLSSAALFDLSHTLASPLLENCDEPWRALPKLKEFILSLGDALDAGIYHQLSPGIWVAKSAVIAPTAVILAPAIIGENTEVRHCAFLRGATLIGNDCVVGNSCELKNCILFDSVQVPHFNYVGDSILGYRSHMGAGAVTSNVKSDHSTVALHNGGVKIETGMKKLGALLGDFVEIGCNSVLNPGTVIGRHSRVYPLTSVRGSVPPDSIVKATDTIVPLK